MKPLIRWTIGDCIKVGQDVLAESIRQAVNIFGRSFDFIVCSNSQNPDFIQLICERNNVGFYQPSWDEFPLVGVTTPRSRLPDLHCHGVTGYDTFWKACPPRMRANSHEIILDNDVVFRKFPDQIKRFLESSDAALCVLENMSAHGKFYERFSEKEKYNSGIIGLPPGYDFGRDIVETWKLIGEIDCLGCRDEQGLLTYTLKKRKHFLLEATQVIQLFSSGVPVEVSYGFEEEGGLVAKYVTDIKCKTYEFTGEEDAFHFAGVNRHSHDHWNKYKQWRISNI